MMPLASWAQQFRIVDEGSHTYRVQLLTTADSEVWHTWERDELGETWLDSANSYHAAMADQLPPGRHALEFVALDQAGSIRSRCPGYVLGRNKDLVKPKVGTEFTALTNAMTTLANSCKLMVELKDDQIRIQQKMIEALVERQDSQLADLIKARENNDSALTTALVNALTEHGGPILAVLPDLIKTITQKPVTTPQRPLAAVPNPKG